VAVLRRIIRWISAQESRVAIASVNWSGRLLTI
jgi:hypothetical protein